MEFIAGVLSAVIASVIMLFIERRFFPVKESVSQPSQNTQREQIEPLVKPRSVTQVANIPGWALITLSIFLPPLAVYFEKGAHQALWINIGLTLLWLWPGVFHALFIIVGSKTKSA